MSDVTARPDAVKRAYALSGALFVTGVAVYAVGVASRGKLPTGVSLSPLVVVALTVLLSASAVTVQFRRQAQTLALTELPLALGLLSMSPLSLIGAKAVAHAVDGVRRRIPAYKVVFNVAVVVFQAPLAVYAFRLMLGDAAPLGPRGWLAAWVAVQIANLLSAAAVAVVIRLTQSNVERGGFDVAVGKWVLVSLVETSLALVAIEALRAEPEAGWLLALVTLLLLGFARAYASLHDRNDELAAVYDFGRSVAAPDDPAALPGFVASKVRLLLNAERAEVLLAYDDGVTCWRADEDGVRVVTGDAEAWPWSEVAANAAPVLGTRGRDAVAVPLRGESGIVGMLAAYERMGNVRRFGRVDVQLLEALAAQAGATLESARLVQRLRHEAAHDTLTGLGNWTALRDRIDASIAAGGAVALVLVDLDRFKDVNDTLGHHNGDVLLVELARRLARYCGDRAIVGRLGGDEFAVVLSEGSDADTAARVARDLSVVIAHPVVLEGVRIEMAASIGIAVYPEHGADSAALLQRADVAMYTAKATHAGVAVYQPSEDHVSARRLVLAGELRRAIDNDGLVVAYQPKASLEDGRIVGLEALLRWQHPDLGFVTPDEFIPLAERTGLIVPLTTYVLDRALRQCAQWLVDGFDCGVAVNISVRNLLDSDLPDEIGALLVRHGVEPRRLTLEITESSVMADPARAIDVLERLHRIGIRLSVDDFGTGYSSLTYLKRLPVDEVKIDKSFVLTMATDAGDAAIVRSIIDLGGSLGLTVVAEGVEDTAAWERLAELGCDLIQGYALCRPGAGGDLTRWMRTWDPARAIRRSSRAVADLAQRRRIARGLDG
ncbi:MAG TPA: EAL domain-containing protein [Mycobacteriales bacterium]|jgi:diguanylate cyclase (GGDEF)-like protein